MVFLYQNYMWFAEYWSETCFSNLNFTETIWILLSPIIINAASLYQIWQILIYVLLMSMAISVRCINYHTMLLNHRSLGYNCSINYCVLHRLWNLRLIKDANELQLEPVMDLTQWPLGEVGMMTKCNLKTHDTDYEHLLWNCSQVKTMDWKSTLVWVVTWGHLTRSHYLNQYWWRYMSPLGITKPQWFILEKQFDSIYVSSVKPCIILNT